ncbi:hypothetical protein GW750_01905 [bacterium]|nr:hypothetical protein [bacterium]
MQQNILQYIQTYKEIPLCIRILKTPVKNITTSTIQSQDTQKIRDILATNAYTVHITAIDTPPLATDTYKNNIYTQPLAVKA